MQGAAETPRDTLTLQGRIQTKSGKQDFLPKSYQNKDFSVEANEKK